MTSESWYLLDSGPGHYAFNMALDEALLEASSSIGHPILRYYGWTEGRLLPWPTEGQSSVVHFQWAQGGAGYWIDRECSLLLAKHMFDRDQCEDAAVGRTLYSFGIHPVHDARYWPEAFPNHRDNPEPYITLHKCNPQQMREVHQRIEALKC